MISHYVLGVNIMSVFIIFLLLFVPGFIAMAIFRLRSGLLQTCCCMLFAALVFDLLILLINSIWLVLLNVTEFYGVLAEKFNCIEFSVIYTVVSIIAAVLLGLIAGSFGGKKAKKQNAQCPPPIYSGQSRIID
jgi:hypothetical protein